MSTNYKKLGDYIEVLNRRNTDLKLGLDSVRGISNTKQITETSKATVDESVISKFYVINPGEFVYNPRTTRMGDKVGLAFNNTDKPLLFTFNNLAFKIKDSAKDKLLPNYLYLFFCRSEFDRYARINSWGSATELFLFEDLCNIKFTAPDIKEQEKIVNTYNAITKRIQLKQKINENLEKTAILKFENMLDNESLEKKKIKVASICEVKGGKRLPLDSDLIENRNSHPYIRIRDIKENCFVMLNNEFLYVDDETQKEIARYITETNDLLISIVGTIGLTALVHKSLDKANLTENCVKLTKMKKLIPEYVLIYLRTKAGQSAISQATVGAVQAKLPLKNIQNLDVPFFEDSIMKEYNDFLRKTFICVSNNLEEIIQLQSFRQLVISRISGM